MINKIIRIKKLKRLEKANRSNEELFQYLESGKPFTYVGWRSGEYPTFSIFDNVESKYLTQDEIQANREFGYYVWYLAEKRAEEELKQRQDKQKKNAIKRVELLEKELKELKEMFDI